MLTKIEIETKKANEIIDVAVPVGEIIRKSNIKDGLVTVYSPHTACGVTLNENTDPELKEDLLRELALLFPKGDPRYNHRGGNADAHIKCSTVGASVSIIVEDRKLLLGQWQSVYFCEFDGPKTRQLFVKILAG